MAAATQDGDLTVDLVGDRGIDWAVETVPIRVQDIVSHTTIIPQPMQSHGLSLCPKRADGVKLGMEKPDEAKREVTNERTTETDKPTAICC